jgi:phosphate transport system substrate-binding protein
VKVQRYAVAAGAGMLAVATLAACGTNNNTPTNTNTASSGASASPTASVACGTGTLNIAGSTAQQNAIQKFAIDFQNNCSGSTINYNGSGSGAGLTSFEQKQVDFAGSDYPLNSSNQSAANAACSNGGPAIDLPMVPGLISVMYNITGVDKSINLKASTIAKIFNGKITNWNDPEIAAENPGVTFPSLPLTTVHRSDTSGTSYNFSNFLNQTDPTDFPTAANKQWPGTGGEGESGSSGVAQTVSTTPGAVGYAELSYANADKLQVANVGNADNQYVPINATNAANFFDQAQVVANGDDLQLQFNYKYASPTAYPAVLVTYEIVCGTGNNPAQLTLIKNFLTYMDSASEQSQLPGLGYVELPTAIQTKVLTSIESMK